MHAERVDDCVFRPICFGLAVGICCSGCCWEAARIHNGVLFGREFLFLLPLVPGNILPGSEVRVKGIGAREKPIRIPASPVFLHVVAGYTLNLQHG